MSVVQETPKQRKKKRKPRKECDDTEIIKYGESGRNPTTFVSV